jgi:lipopolysaccharide export system permease protein
MFTNTLQRAIAWELLKVFTLTITVVTGILVLVGMVSEAAEYGLTPAELLATIPLIIPNFMPYTIPAATLFSSCLVYGRLASDNEIVALRAAGVHLFCIVWPAILLGIGATAVTACLYYDVIPTSQYLLRTRWLQAAEDLFYRMLQNRMHGDLPGLGYKVWVRDVHGRELIDVIFKRPGPQGRYDVVGHAQSADLSIDAEHNQLLVHLKKGEIIDVVRETQIGFTERTLPLRLPDQFLALSKGRGFRELTIPELVGHREKALNQLAQLDAALNGGPNGEARGDAEACETPPRADLERSRNWFRYDLRSTEIQLSIRPAVAFSCFGFMLVGCPVGVWVRRKDYLSTFVACFIPTIGIYYPFLLRGIQLSERGRANPFVALWVGDIVLLAAGLVMVARLVRR